MAPTAVAPAGPVATAGAAHGSAGPAPLAADVSTPAAGAPPLGAPPALGTAPGPATAPGLGGEDMTARLEAARGLVHDGDVLGARAVLAEAALASVPEAAYVLAETYDPNVLAMLGITDVRAEVELARLFYERALAGGVAPARQRLEALR